MTVAIPYAVGTPISRWQVVDWISTALSSKPAAGGTATVTFPELDIDHQWLIDRAVAQCNSGTGTSLRLYDSSAVPRQLLSGTNTGNFDEAEYDGGLLLRPQSSLVAVWNNASDGAVGTLRVQARLMRQVSS